MPDRILAISDTPARISISNGCLTIKAPDNSEVLQRVRPSELAAVVIDNPQVTYTHSALAALVAAGSTLIVCGADHLPSGVLIPVVNHQRLVERFRAQIDISAPLRKQLWRRIITAKIAAQASNLEHVPTVQRRMIEIGKSVRSGDVGNAEAKAARIYWSAWAPVKPFHRIHGQRGGINGMLDYGYSIIRAAIARQCVASGLQTAVGIHHRNRSNAFCLADDLIEPLRPMIDKQVRRVALDGRKHIDSDVKKSLLSVMHSSVDVGNRIVPLITGISFYIYSFVRSLEEKAQVLEIPIVSADVDDLDEDF